MDKVRRRLIGISVLGLVALPSGVILFKLFALDYSFRDVLPQTQYTVTYQLSLDGHGGEARVQTFLPVTDARQQVSAERNESPGLYLRTEVEGLNRRAVWSGTHVRDGAAVSYSFDVLGSGVRYELDPTLQVPRSYPSSVTPYLQPEEEIQVDHPEIVQTLRRIGADRGAMVERLQKIYDLAAALEPRPFKGTTDALTALRLGEASCNGKSRLLVALARASGIPARLVGGLVMRSGTKRTSHQWAEAYIAGHWVPFDATNRHFAALPGRYLALYYGDEVLFRHSADVNFQYAFGTSAALVPSAKARSTFKLFNIWSLFDRLGLSFLLLRTILMLPIGALVVVVFRNVIGMPTFGTFLPALIAAAAGETGLAWGLSGVLLVVAIAATTRWMFQRLELLHSPSLAILLAAVAVSLLGTSLVADRVGATRLAYVTLFPVAVMAITAERFYLSLTERGRLEAIKELGGTLLVIAACFVVMNSLALQILVIGFPEVLLFVVAANVYLGRWIGIRLLEYLRFRHVLLQGRAA